MKAQIFSLVFLFSVFAHAEIYRLTPEQVTDIAIDEAKTQSCRSAPDGKLVSLKIVSSQGTFTESLCSDSDRLVFLYDLYHEARQLAVNPGSVSSCVISETCRGNVCRREYGKTVITRHEIVLFTNSGTKEVREFNPVLESECRR